jgi:hypothetical protein
MTPSTVAMASEKLTSTLHTNSVATLQFGYVRFGSKADMCGANRYVRFSPESDRESRHPQKAMSALPLNADMGGATSDVR